MGRLRLDVNVARPVGEPRGVAPGQGVREAFAVGAANASLVRAVTGLGQQTMAVAEHYAEKNRAADEQADRMSYEQRKDEVFKRAQIEAGQTSDPEKIRSIWNNAHVEVDGWVQGESDGVPNVRWRPQQAVLQKDSDGLRNRFHLFGEARIAEASRENTNVKSLRLQSEAEMAGDEQKILAAIDMRVANGTITREIGDEELIGAMQRSNVHVAGLNVARIENMEPEQAERAAGLFKKNMAGQYPHLDDEQKLQFEQMADAAAAGSKRRAERARIEYEREQNDAFMEWQLANPDESLTFDKVRELFPGMDRGTQLKIMRGEQEAAAVDRGAAEAAAGARELLAEINGGAWAKDETHGKQLDLYARISALPTEWKGYLTTLFHEMRKGEEPDASEFDKTKAVVLGEISELVGELDYKVFGSGFDKRSNEQAFYAAKEQDVFLDWVKREKPTADKMMEYMNTGRIKMIRDARSIEEFRRVQAMDLQPVAKKRGAQGVYADDDLNAVARRLGRPVR